MREDCNIADVASAISTAIFILIHAYARIATAFCFVVPCPTYILIHACARIATNGFAHLVRRQLILIHVCARVTTWKFSRFFVVAAILIHTCLKIATQDIPKDCRGRCYFDSCMCEDCNEGPGVGGVGGILIHACARIATSIRRIGAGNVLIHACVRIATNRIGRPSVSPSHFDSCMREDCNND